MPVVSSQYWNMVHGNTPDEVRQDLEGLQIMRTLGRNMAWLLQCIDAGKKSKCVPPKAETPCRHQFYPVIFLKKRSVDIFTERFFRIYMQASEAVAFCHGLRVS